MTEFSATVVVWSYGYPRNTNYIRFWLKFRPASQNGISAEWFNTQSSASQNFGLAIQFSCHGVRFGPFLFDLCLLFAIFGTLPLMKCCHVASYFMTEPRGVSQDVAVLPDGEFATDNRQSQVQSKSQEDEASTEGFQKKHKAARKKNSTSSIKLSDRVTSTTKIKVRWDQIVIDDDRKFGQVRRISDDRV